MYLCREVAHESIGPHGVSGGCAQGLCVMATQDSGVMMSVSCYEEEGEGFDGRCDPKTRVANKCVRMNWSRSPGTFCKGYRDLHDMQVGLCH